MKVSELIAELQKFDPNLPAVTYIDDGAGYHPAEVTRAWVKWTDEQRHAWSTHAGEEGAAMPIIQGFIHQDVIVSGSMLYGQLIELQSTVNGEFEHAA